MSREKREIFKKLFVVSACEYTTCGGRPGARYDFVTL
jgi:hypothetical protein